MKNTVSFLLLGCLLMGVPPVGGYAQAASDQNGATSTNSDVGEKRQDSTILPLPLAGDVEDLQTLARRRQLVYPLLVREAEKDGLPVEIADAVARIESGYHPEARGAFGEIGLMQVRPGTAAMLGFKGSNDELAVPDTNVRLGVAYLSKAWSLANGDVCRALMKYRAGHGEESMTLLSTRYCARAKAYLASIGSSYGNTPPEENVSARSESGANSQRSRVSSGLPPLPRPRIRTASVSRAFWTAQEARIRILTARVHAKWQRMAAR